MKTTFAGAAVTTTLLLIASSTHAQGAAASAPPAAPTAAGAGTPQKAAPPPAAATPPPAAAPPREETPPPARQEAPKASAKTFILRPVGLPPTRTYCTLESTDEDGRPAESVTVEWDPIASQGLARKATLRAQEAAVACWSEPSRHPLNPTVNYAWEFQVRTNCPGGEIRGTTLNGATAAGNTVVFARSQPTALIDCKAIDGSAKGTFLPPTPVLPVERGLGTFAEDSISVAAEVITEAISEKAQAEAMKVVERRILRDYCSGDAPFRLDRFCGMVRNVRLSDAASMAEPLLLALGQDLVDVAWDGVTECNGKKQEGGGNDQLIKPGDDGLCYVRTLSLEAMRGSTLGLRGASQRLLLATPTPGSAKADATGAVKEVKKVSAMALHSELIGLLSVCMEENRCDAGRIRALAAAPKAYGADLLAHEVNKAPLFSADEIAELLADAQAVLRPSAQSSEAERMRVALRVVFAIAEKATLAAPNTPGEDTSRRELLRLMIKSLHAVADASIRRDIVSMIGPLRELIAIGDAYAPDADDYCRYDEPTACEERTAQQRLEDIQKQMDADPRLLAFFRVASALAAHLDVKPTGAGDEEAQEERREARKAALRNLIATQTSRGSRTGEAIFSLGGTIATAPRVSYAPKSDEATGAWSPVSLRVGLGFDYMDRSRWGFHTSIAPVDLGAYLAVDAAAEDDLVEPEAADLLDGSIVVGLTHAFFDDSEVLMLIGAQAGLNPVVDQGETNRSSVFYVGGLLGFYVPLIDLN